MLRRTQPLEHIFRIIAFVACLIISMPSVGIQGLALKASPASAFHLTNLGIPLLFAATALGILIPGYLAPRRQVASHIYILALSTLLFVGLMQYSFIPSFRPWLGIMRGILFAVAVALYFSYISPPELGAKAKIFVYASCISLTFALFMHFVLHSQDVAKWQHAGRFQGLTQHPNQLSIFCVATLPLVLWMRTGLFEKTILMSIVLIALLMSGSKFGLFVGMLEMATYMLTRLRYTGAVAVLTLSIAAPTFIANIGTLASPLRSLNQVYFDQMTNFVRNPYASESFQDRKRLQEMAGDLVGDHFWQGIGLGQQLNHAPYPHFHNFLLDYLVTSGLPGLVLIVLITSLPLLAFLVSALRQMGGRGQKLHSWPYAIALAAITIQCLVSESFGPFTLPLQALLSALLFTAVRADMAERAEP